MEQQIEAEQWVPYRIEHVFAFFADPANFPLLLPAQLETKIEDLQLRPPPARKTASQFARKLPGNVAGAGSEFLIGFRPFGWPPLRMHSRIQITKFVWNSHFCYEQIQGPFHTFSHFHSLKPEVRKKVDGTRVTDTIDYALPGRLVELLGGTKVRKKIAEALEYRQERLLEALATVVRLAEQCG
ncbi:MAG: cyclase [Terracidiphilus sp.]|jgi:ligand-binding SRPBCC domain-containing protein